MNFMCIADDKDESFLKNLKETYKSDIHIEEYSVGACCNGRLK